LFFSDKNDKEKYAFQLLKKYGDNDSDDDEKKNDFLQKMEEDGFTVVRNHQGSFNLKTKQPEVLEKNPAKKNKLFLQDFYKFQTRANGHYFLNIYIYI